MGNHYLEEDVRRAALARLAWIFGRAIDEMTEKLRFDSDLKVSFLSSFRDNEFDRIDHDIKDVATTAIRSELASGKLEIWTVGDYCDHMVRCWKANEREVARVLGLSN
jgi:hypothetical protein